MMKRKILIILFLIVIFSPSVMAVDTTEDITAQQASAFGFGDLEKAVPDSAKEYLDGVSLDTGLDLGTGVQSIIKSGTSHFSTALKKAMKNAALVLVIILLCSLVGSLHESLSSKAVPSYIALASALAITAATAGDLNSFIGLGRETIDQIMLFSKALLPTLAAATVAGGSPVTSGVNYVAAVLFSDILITIIDKLLMPLVYVYIAASAADAAIGNGSLSRIAELVKWGITTALKALLLIFTAYITVSGIISGSADTAAIKAVKLTLSGSIPVVGSIIADASETVLASAGVLKNTVGIFGMLVVLAVTIGPFIQIGVQYLTFKVTAALSATIAESRVTKLIDNIGSAMGILLGMTGSCALMTVISCVCAIKAVMG